MQEMYKQLMFTEVLVEYRQNDVPIISFPTTITGIYEWMDGFMLVGGKDSSTEIYITDYMSVYDEDVEEHTFVCNDGSIVITPL